MKKIIFYPGPMHLFWTTGIYYLNELSKYFEVALVLEKATVEDEEKVNYLIKGRFKRICYIKHANKIRRHRIYKNTAIKLVNEIKPDFVFTINDWYPFSTYLLYHAKKKGSINICYQSGIFESTVSEQGRVARYMETAEKSRIYKIPAGVARLLVEGKRQLKHYWHYYAAPILVGHYPFIGPSSAYLLKGRPCMRDGDHYLVFGGRERNLCISDNLPKDKIVIISHPLTWKSNVAFKKKYLNLDLLEKNVSKTPNNIITIFSSDLICDHAICRETQKSIDRQEIYNSWKMMIETTSNKFPNDTIQIKLHPNQSMEDDFVKCIQGVSRNLKNVRFVDNNKDGWYYVINSKMVIGETTSLLYTTSLYFKDKIIISFDLNKRLLGDIYKSSKNIVYITNIKDFENVDLNTNKEVELMENNDGEKLIKFLSDAIADRNYS